MAWHDEGNGWRDEADEGPGMDVYSTKEGFEVTQPIRGPYIVAGVNMVRVEGPAHAGKKAEKVVHGYFKSKSAAKLYVDAVLAASAPKDEDVKFLLEQIRLDSRWQSTKKILDLMEKYK